MVSSDVAAVFVGVLRQLDSGAIPYMIVGSVGSIVYGEPRMTKDMDIVIAVGPPSAIVFETLFPPDHYYCPPAEVLRAVGAAWTIARCGSLHTCMYGCVTACTSTFLSKGCR